MEFCILQNNAFNIYEMYFDDLEPSCLVDKSSARTVNMYRDPCPIKRPVTHVSWSPDGGSRIAVTHCNFDFQRAPPDLSTASYIWEVGEGVSQRLGDRQCTPQVYGGAAYLDRRSASETQP